MKKLQADRAIWLLIVAAVLSTAHAGSDSTDEATNNYPVTVSAVGSYSSYHPVTSSYSVVSAGQPQQWVYATPVPATGSSWSTTWSASGAPAGSAPWRGQQQRPKRWRRRQQHQHQYPVMMQPAGAAALRGSTPGPAWSPSTPVGATSGSTATSGPAATAVPNWTSGPGPVWGPSGSGSQPSSQSQRPQQPGSMGMGPAGGGGGASPPKRPAGGTMPGPGAGAAGAGGAAMGATSGVVPTRPLAPGGSSSSMGGSSASAWVRGRVNGTNINSGMSTTWGPDGRITSSSSWGANNKGSGSSSSSSSGGMPAFPGGMDRDDDDVEDDASGDDDVVGEDDDDSGTVGPAPTQRPSPSPSPRSGSMGMGVGSWAGSSGGGGAGGMGSWGSSSSMGSGLGSSSSSSSSSSSGGSNLAPGGLAGGVGGGMWSALRASPRPGLIPVTGPSKADPDRPWLSPGGRPGMLSPGSRPSAATPSPSPKASGSGPSWLPSTVRPGGAVGGGGTMGPRPDVGVGVGVAPPPLPTLPRPAGLGGMGVRGSSSSSPSPTPTSSSSSSMGAASSSSSDWEEPEDDSEEGNAMTTAPGAPATTSSSSSSGAASRPSGGGASPLMPPSMRPPSPATKPAMGGMAGGGMAGAGGAVGVTTPTLRSSPSPSPATGLGAAVDAGDTSDDAVDEEEEDESTAKTTPAGAAAASSSTPGPGGVGEEEEEEMELEEDVLLVPGAAGAGGAAGAKVPTASSSPAPSTKPAAVTGPAAAATAATGGAGAGPMKPAVGMGGPGPMPGMMGPGPMGGGLIPGGPGGGRPAGMGVGGVATGPKPPIGASGAAAAAAGGAGPLGLGGLGGVGGAGIPEAGPRTNVSVNASSTATGATPATAPPTGFRLGPAIRQGVASAVAGALGASPQQAAAAGAAAAAAGANGTAVAPGGILSLVVDGAAASLLKAPEPWLLKQAGAKDTIVVGCVLPFEGSDQDVVGKAVHAALKMALNDMSAQKPLPFNVNLTCYNTRCLDIPTHMAMKKLAQEGAVAVIGEICSAATVSAAGVAAEQRIPLISPSASSPQLTNMPYFFRTVPSDRYQGAAAAELARKMGVKNMGMVYEDTSYGYGLAFNFIASFSKDGGQVPVVYTFAKRQGDAKTAVAKMLEGKKAGKLPINGVFISTNNLTFFSEFLVAAAAAKLDLPIFGGDAIASPAMGDMLKGKTELLKGVTVTAFAPGSESFQQAFAKAAPGLEYDGNAAQGYDAMTTLIKAYLAAPKAKGASGGDASVLREPADVAMQIPLQNFTGVSGPVSFDRKGSTPPSADLLPHDKSYISVTFDPKTGALKNGSPIAIP